jgi:hypothetical protein
MGKLLLRSFDFVDANKTTTGLLRFAIHYRASEGIY